MSTPAVGILGAFLLLVGGVGYMLGRSSVNGDGSANTAAGVETLLPSEGATFPTTSSLSVVTQAPTTIDPPSTNAFSTTAPPDLTPTTVPSTPPPTTVPSPTSELVTATTSGVFGPDDTRRAVFKGGVVYLGGEVPSQEVADLIAGRVAEVVGPENVVVEYTINPEAPIPESAPLHVADLVLFETGTAQITDPFKPLLDLGTRLLQINPNVRIDVIAHTDSIGPAVFNQDLSERRAAAVKQYWIDVGIDPTRITASGKGESEPIAENTTADGRRLNRRAEFIVSGLVG